METYEVCRDLAIIIIAAKVCGLIARKCKAPQVVGEIIAGLLIGPSILNLVTIGDTSGGQITPLSVLAEIGVIFLMFSAGLETDLKQLIQTGPIALLIACAGVAVPLLGGTLLYECYYGFSPVGSTEFMSAIFIGTIMTATSVGITVQSLRELGHLKGKVGTTIMSAAIIDDVIGIIVLTVVIGFEDPSNNPGRVVISTILFFLVAIGAGMILNKILKWLDERYPHTRRIPIIAVALCFSFSYIAEKYFGIADITGAYVAGIILSNLNDSSYIDRKVDVNSYIIFGPVFFASIGLKTDLSSVTGDILLFSLLFVLVALVTKIVGCGLVAKLCRFPWKDSLKVGVGMMTRGEVALIVAQKGLAAGLISSAYFAAVILLIIFSSILTPIILKLLYKGEPEEV